MVVINLIKIIGDRKPAGAESLKAATSAGETREPPAKEVPTKCVPVKQLIPIRAKIEYIDFEGRSDGDSVRKIIQQIRPRAVAHFLIAFTFVLSY